MSAASFPGAVAPVIAFDAGRTPGVEHLPGTPAGAVSSASPSPVGADSRPVAAASTPSVGAARVDFLFLHEVADAIGMDGFELILKFRPAHWRLGWHFFATRGGYEVREAALCDWVGELTMAGRLRAAAALLGWLVRRSEGRIAAASGGTSGIFADAASRRIPATRAPIISGAPGGWLNAWEALNS